MPRPITICLPRNTELSSLAHALGESGATGEDWEAATVLLSDGCFLRMPALAELCTWGLLQRENGRNLTVDGRPGDQGYLQRMRLHQHLGWDFDDAHFRNPQGRFLPLRLIADDDDVFRTVDELCEIVLAQFDNAREFLPAFEWAVNELLGNIVLHAESPVPGAVCAQYYPKKRRIDVGLADSGRGILASLGQSRKLFSHGHAITTALERGVTRDPDVGQGNGMAGSLEIVLRNGGMLRIRSGDALFTAARGENKGFELLPELPGVGVLISLHTDHPISLGDTWIATHNSNWNYITKLAEDLDDAPIIRVADACLGTGTRGPGQRLRRRLNAILPDMEEPLVLDFEGVERAASSFLDELLGRLAADLGPESFSERVRVLNLAQELSDMANTVIHQRLQVEGEGG